MPRKPKAEGRKERSKANGEGSVYFDEKREKWVGEWIVPGTGKRLRCRSEKKGDVTAQIAEWRRDHSKGEFTMPTKDTVGQLLTMWLEQVVSLRKPNTQRGYKNVVHKHIKPALGKIPLAQLTPARIQTLLYDVRQTGCSDYLVRNVYAVLHRCLQYAVENQILARNPADNVERPKEPDKEMRVLTKGEGLRFLEAAKPERFYALWVVALYLGLREGELLGLRWSDIDFDAGTLSVKQTVTAPEGKLIFDTPKSKASRRTLPMPPDVAEALHHRKVIQNEERLASPKWHDHDLVFTTGIGTPYSPFNLIRRDFPRVMTRAGLTTQESYRTNNNRLYVRHTPICRIHDLRHTAITMTGRTTRNVRLTQSFAGHSRPEVTLKVYSHVFQEDMVEAANAINDAWQQPQAKQRRRG